MNINGLSKNEVEKSRKNMVTKNEENKQKYEIRINVKKFKKIIFFFFLLV